MEALRCGGRLDKIYDEATRCGGLTSSKNFCSMAPGFEGQKPHALPAGPCYLLWLTLALAMQTC